MAKILHPIIMGITMSIYKGLNLLLVITILSASFCMMPSARLPSSKQSCHEESSNQTRHTQKMGICCNVQAIPVHRVHAQFEGPMTMFIDTSKEVGVSPIQLTSNPISPTARTSDLLALLTILRI
ncbi:MAG: hypothetical protein C5B54_05810 [Acidobacteria bacterium]|nr:MAG: hypothetical protein C5B54_05810 [Acidobacteriota bacterium]